MRTIYKQQIEIIDRQEIEMPQQSEILSVQFQGKNLCVWYGCDPSLPKQKKVILIYGTGHPINNFAIRYIFTVQNDGLVWHIFEERKIGVIC